MKTERQLLKEYINYILESYQQDTLLESSTYRIVDFNKIKEIDPNIEDELSIRKENKEYKILLKRLQNSKTKKLRLTYDTLDLIASIYEGKEKYDAISSELYGNISENEIENKYNIFQEIKQFRPYAKYENYKKMPVKQMLAILYSEIEKNKKKNASEKINSKDDLSPEEWEDIYRQIDYQKEHPPIIHGKYNSYIRTDNGGYEIIDEADLGYHYGDLGKGRDTYRVNMERTSRDTGHLGTGTYFLSKPNDSKNFSRKDREVKTVDFSKYHLYKPKDVNEARILHNFLKTLNDHDFEAYPIASKVESYISKLDNSSEPGLEALNDEIYNYLVSLDLDVKSKEDYTSLYDYRNATSDDAEWYKQYLLEYLSKIDDFYANKADKFKNYIDLLTSSTQITDSAYEVGRDAVFNAANKDTEDSLSTIFMKALGYEGIDVRHIPEFDNTTYGSVIYDLKESSTLTEANLQDLINDSKATDPKRIKLAQSIYTEYKGVDSDGTLIFESDSQTRSGITHTQRIFYDKFFDLLDKADQNESITDEDVVNILTGDLRVDCTCESFLYWAWAYKSWKNDYGLQKELRAPKRNNVALHGGACFTGDTLIATREGFKPIKNIQVGDLILTHKGRFKPVIHVFEPHNDEIIEVQTNSKSIFCTKDHPFYTATENWVEIKDFGRNVTTKAKPVTDGKLHFDKKYPFMMGIYLGDGNATIKKKKSGKYSKLNINCKNPIREGYFISSLNIANDNRLLDKYISIANEYGFEWTDQSIKVASQLSKHHKSLNVKNSNDFLHFINKWGGFTCSKLGWKKKIKPEVLDQWDDESLKELLKGFYLADGTCTKYSNKYANIVLYSTNKEMLYQIYLIARKFYNASIADYSRPSTNLKDEPTELYGVKLYGKDAEDFYNFCKTESGLKTNKSFRFSKRKDKSHENFYEGNTVKIIETGRIEPVYNIEVKDDNSYCVGADMVIVHNCKHLLSVLELLNRSDSLFDKIAEDLNNLFQQYKKRPNSQDTKPKYEPVDDTQFARTAANLANKGKTNKKLNRNPKAAEYNIPLDRNE